MDARIPSTARLIAWAALGLLAATGESRASIVLTLEGGTPKHAGGVFKYSYDADLTKGSVINPGDSFAVIDFQGYVAGSAFSTNKDFSVSEVGKVSQPGSLSFPDDPSVPDLVFTYTGKKPLDADDLKGDFGARSTVGSLGLLTQISQDHDKNWAGDPVNSSTQILGPGGASPFVVVAPQPPSLLLGGIGMSALAGCCMIRRRPPTANA